MTDRGAVIAGHVGVGDGECLNQRTGLHTDSLQKGGGEVMWSSTQYNL